MRAAFERWARAHPGRPFAVAFSGGADSTALLIEAARWQQAHGAGLTALHVHHGLQPAADAFVAHAQAVCAALDAQVPTRLCVERVCVRVDRGASIEAQARAARYAALARAAQAQGLDTVLLAQHADDQAETLLLALSRGAGTAGVASMAPAFECRGTRFERPLLGVAAPALRGWLREQGIAWVEDPSNADERRTRNRLRRRVLPALQEALPAFRATFARSARLAAQAQALLDERAAEDLLAVGDPPRLAALRGLSRARSANLLRHWLRQRHGAIGSEVQIEALLDVIDACRTRAQRIRIRVGRGYAERDGEHLAWRGDAPPAA